VDVHCDGGTSNWLAIGVEDGIVVVADISSPIPFYHIVWRGQLARYFPSVLSSYSLHKVVDIGPQYQHRSFRKAGVQFLLPVALYGRRRSHGLFEGL